MLVRMWWDILLAGMQTDTVILEICLEVFQKLKIELPFDSAIPHPQRISYCIVEDTCIPTYAMTLFTMDGMDSV